MAEALVVSRSGALARPCAIAQWLLILGPAALLGGALAFQYLGGLHPCEMCIWQRWPLGIALALALAALAAPPRVARVLLSIAAVCVLVGAAIAVDHVGVEHHWWRGPEHCAASINLQGDLIAASLKGQFTSCDVPQWSLVGITMAGWNVIFSTLIGGTALWRLTRRP